MIKRKRKAKKAKHRRPREKRRPIRSFKRAARKRATRRRATRKRASSKPAHTSRRSITTAASRLNANYARQRRRFGRFAFMLPSKQFKGQRSRVTKRKATVDYSNSIHTSKVVKQKTLKDEVKKSKHRAAYLTVNVTLKNGKRGQYNTHAWGRRSKRKLFDELEMYKNKYGIKRINTIFLTGIDYKKPRKQRGKNVVRRYRNKSKR